MTEKQIFAPYQGHILVSDQYKLIVHVPPKCACTYIIRWMSKVDGFFDEHGHTIDDNKCQKYGTVHWCSLNNPHNWLLDYKLTNFERLVLTEEGTNKIKTYHKVFVVRNPFDRLVSFYLANHKYGTFKDMILNKLINKKDTENDDHIYQQAKSLFFFNYNEVIDFKDLEKGFEKLRLRLGIPIPFNCLKINNKTVYQDVDSNSQFKEQIKQFDPTGHKINYEVSYMGNVDFDELPKPYPHWIQFYDGDLEGSITRQIIKKIYQEDFKLLEIAKKHREIYENIKNN